MRVGLTVAGVKRPGWVLLGVAAVGGVLAAAGVVAAMVRVGADADRSCVATSQADEAKIRTDRWQSLAEDLPEIGDYVEIHWQARAAGDTCSRASGPTDRRYQGLVRLQPQDARALADGYDWQPVAATASPGTYQWDTPAQMWPALTAFSPAEPHWLHSGAYAKAHFQHGRWGDLYLDPAAGFAFFVLQDH